MGFGARRTSYMQNYQPAMSSALAALCCTWAGSSSFMWQTGKTSTGILDIHQSRPLWTYFKPVVRGAILTAAENYLGSSCLRPNQPAPANAKKADHFNQSIQADVF